MAALVLVHGVRAVVFYLILRLFKYRLHLRKAKFKHALHHSPLLWNFVPFNSSASPSSNVDVHLECFLAKSKVISGYLLLTVHTHGDLILVIVLLQPGAVTELVEHCPGAGEIVGRVKPMTYRTDTCLFLARCSTLLG